jgi:hypothetical protein
MDAQGVDDAADERWEALDDGGVVAEAGHAGSVPAAGLTRNSTYVDFIG